MIASKLSCAFLALCCISVASARAFAQVHSDFIAGGTLTQGYSQKHPGVDISKRQGSKPKSGASIMAGCKGKVIKVYAFDKHHKLSEGAAEWLKNFNTVVVQCDDGTFYTYAHSETVSVTEGDNVTEATEIGKTGGYGPKCKKTFGPHLHLELRCPDTDDPGTPEDESEWDGVDEARLCAVDPAMSKDPIPGAVCKIKKAQSGGTGTPTSGGGYKYEYNITNDPDSDLDLDAFRVEYLGHAEYSVTGTPPGWVVFPFAESTNAVFWYSTDAAFDVPPGSSLGGFSYEAVGTPSTGDYWTGVDDDSQGPIVTSLGANLVTNTSEISLSAGGIQVFSLVAGFDGLQDLYWVFGTVTGTDPGLLLGNVQLSLNHDAYSLLTIRRPNSFIASSRGFLSPTGTATASLFVPAGIDPSLAGIRMHHAALLMDPSTFAVKDASNPVALDLIP